MKIKIMEVEKLLPLLDETKKIFEEIHEYDDCDMIELLQIKYYRVYEILKNSQ